ncbi:hypothetical protein M3J09_001289 [Ascochyta lentis]
MSAGSAMRGRREFPSTNVPSVPPDLVLDVDAVLGDRATSTCGVGDVLSASRFGLAPTSVTPSCLVSPTATRTLKRKLPSSCLPRCRIPSPSVLVGARHGYTGRLLRPAETMAVHLHRPGACPAIAVTARVFSDIRNEWNVNVTGPAVQCTLGGPVRLGLCTFHANGGRWIGSACAMPAASDRWLCASLAASGAKPTVRISFDPVPSHVTWGILLSTS